MKDAGAVKALRSLLPEAAWDTLGILVMDPRQLAAELAGDDADEQAELPPGAQDVSPEGALGTPQHVA